MAIGAGIGYRLNERTEIWSETSLLTNGLMMYVGPLTGIRQIFQLKRFIGSDGHFFVAGEIRYKYFSYRDTADFSNPSINETIHNIPYHAYHTVFGAALQAGYRINLSKNGKFQVELTGGIGIKNKIIDRPGVPTGYTEYVTPSVDLNIYDFIESRGISIYFPGSIRVIYPFGKRIR